MITPNAREVTPTTSVDNTELNKTTANYKKIYTVGFVGCIGKENQSVNATKRFKLKLCTNEENLAGSIAQWQLI